MYNHEIENWWRHLGCYDREQISSIPYDEMEDTGYYLTITDNWWERLDFMTKEEIYNDFFDEN